MKKKKQPMLANKGISDIISSLRSDKAESRYAFAQRLGLQTRQIANFEEGRDPMIATLERIADDLGVILVYDKENGWNYHQLGTF